MDESFASPSEDGWCSGELGGARPPIAEVENEAACPPVTLPGEEEEEEEEEVESEETVE